MNLYTLGNIQKKMQEIKKYNEQVKKYNEQVKKIKLYNQMNIKFEMKEKYDSIIPLNLYTCWHTKELPPLMKKNYDLLVNNNLEFKHHLYDEDDCREFIKNNFDAEVLNAYNSLIPCSYKSDLWRFCILYINGGIYMDIKYNCKNGFKLIALTEKEYFVKDRPIHMVYTALIVVKPQNKIMLNCINQIVKNVKKKIYGNNPLEPTGPGLLGSYFSLETIQNMEIYFNVIELNNNKTEDFMVFKKRIILNYYNGYRDEQRKFQKRKQYFVLWNENNIYR